MQKELKNIESILLRIEQVVLVAYSDRLTAEMLQDYTNRITLESPVDEGIAVYREEDLVTISYAMVELRVSRWKIDKMRDEKQLTTIKQGGKRSVRLIKAEVEAAKLWYSMRKGKI